MTAHLRSRRIAVLGITVGLAAVSAIVACGSSNPPVQTAPEVDSGGVGFHPDGSGSNFDGASTSGDGSAGDDGSATGGEGGGGDGSSGDDGSTTDGPSTVDTGADAGPPLCDPNASVNEGAAALVISTTDDDLMGGISDDGLVIAWTSLPSGGTPVVHWSERATTNDAFASVQAVDASFGPFAAEHVALRGDGLRIAMVSADHSHILELGRAARGAAFDTDFTDENFLSVNPKTEGNVTNPGDSPFGSPTLASSFTKTWAFVNGGNGLVVADGVLGVWTQPTFPSTLTPPASSATTLVPTGWAADGRTLFYWDSTAAVERAAWRDPVTREFVLTNDVGSVEQYAVPSASCGSLFYSKAGSGGDLDVFVAPY